MLSQIILSTVLINIVLVGLVKGHIQQPIPNEALNQNLYKDVLDPEQCLEQIRIIRNNTLLTLFFADTGIRIPRGISEGNTLDMGNYHQCIGFHETNTDIQGKYCMIQVPMNQSFVFPWDFNASSFSANQHLNSETMEALENIKVLRTEMQALAGVLDHRNNIEENPLAALTFRLAVCIPKPCTTQQALNYLHSSVEFQYTDEFCRLADDKPWVPGDTVAVVVFSLIGLITVASTTFDVWQTIIMKKDPKTVSVIGRSFSVYTNGRSVMSIHFVSKSIECLDGIRALAMMWIVLLHSFSTGPNWINPIERLQWMTSWQSLWVVTGNIAVDSFFMLSGFLLVYTAIDKFNSKQLLKNVHLFWLNRLLRMFPLLAVAVLLEATYLNRVTDGPIWSDVEGHVHRCRTSWWSTLLHIQNYMNPTNTCVGQTWYLAIDVQLHVLSPLILFWVLSGNKKTAWAALLTGLVVILTASTTYNFIMEFQSTMAARPYQVLFYSVNYYMNTLTRASPFFVGMVFGYIVKMNELVMSKITTTLYYCATFSLSTFVVYSYHPIRQQDWDNQLVDSLVNSFIRPLWALFVGCIVFACVNGYGGPINWFLSLKVWKIHAQMSYGIYLFHYGLMAAVNSSAIAPAFFSVKSVLFKFLAYYTVAFIMTFVMVVLIEAPCNTLFKILLRGKGSNKKEEA